MAILQSVQPLFDDDAPISKQALKQAVLQDAQSTLLAGVTDDKIEISFNDTDGDDMLTKVIDPQAALGYSVFKDESEYHDFINASLYEPSDDEMLEGMNRGTGA